MNNSNQPDYGSGSLMFLKVLTALPHPAAFSVQQFMRVWNAQNLGYNIGQYEDITSLGDFILTHLPLVPQNGVPVITEFVGCYDCPH